MTFGFKSIGYMEVNSTKLHPNVFFQNKCFFKFVFIFWVIGPLIGILAKYIFLKKPQISFFSLTQGMSLRTCYLFSDLFSLLLTTILLLWKWRIKMNFASRKTFRYNLKMHIGWSGQIWYYPKRNYVNSSKAVEVASICK